MFEIGWTEILLAGLVAVLVLRPRDYPEAMRAIGNFIAKARQMAGEFQGQFNEAMRDANLDDVRKTIDEIRDLRNLQPIQQVRETLTQIADEATAIKRDVENTVTNPTAPPPAAEVAAAPVESPPAPPLDIVPGPPPPLPTATEENAGPIKAA